MKIATYNINGINGRLTLLLDWLAREAPDVVCLQELKTADATFPRAALRAAGYGAVWRGQKAHHGVAILARGDDPIVTRRALPGDPDDKQSRYVEAAVQGVLFACLYAPNGNPHPGPRFDYKLRWLERLRAHAQGLLEADLPVVLAGDFNVVPTDADIYSAQSSWRRDALLHPAGRALFAGLLAQGWADAVRVLHPRAPVYTLWDYTSAACARNTRLRIDHVLLSRALVPKLQRAEVDLHARATEGASDHAPLTITLRARAGERGARAP